jgi:type IV secretory pathway VirB4 component
MVIEHRRKATGLADLLLYDALIDNGVLLLQDGALMAGWSFRGPDMASATHPEMAALSARLNSILRLGGGWMIQVDAIRSASPGYPDRGAFPDAITRLIDIEREQQFRSNNAHFESDYFLVVTYLPPEQTEEKIRGWMFEGQREYKSSAERRSITSRGESAALKTSSVRSFRSGGWAGSNPSMSTAGRWFMTSCCNTSTAASPCSIILSCCPRFPLT